MYKLDNQLVKGWTRKSGPRPSRFHKTYARKLTKLLRKIGLNRLFVGKKLIIFSMIRKLETVTECATL